MDAGLSLGTFFKDHILNMARPRRTQVTKAPCVTRSTDSDVDGSISGIHFIGGMPDKLDDNTGPVTGCNSAYTVDQADIDKPGSVRKIQTDTWKVKHDPCRVMNGKALQLSGGIGQPEFDADPVPRQQGIINRIKRGF